MGHHGAMAREHDPIDEDDVDGSAMATQVSHDRDRSGRDRDEVSEAGRRAADVRDAGARARDSRADIRERDAGVIDAGAASDRAEAGVDRLGAAGDRAHAADDRDAASSDREAAAGERVSASIDGLTGTHRRDAGLIELERETARAKRSGQPFVLAFVDVDGLKATNDALGHAAGDHVLREIANTIRSKLRSYDLVVRFGGDEFVCGLAGLTMAEAAERFSLVNAELAEAQHATVTVGLAEVTEGDSLDEVIARADNDLYEQRLRRSSNQD
jgi:diguanylate cyclase (GGDEF)-like protein